MTQFHKMHGAGNDFVVLDLRLRDYPLDPGRVKSLSNRRTGIGFDQLLVLRRPVSDEALARVDIWNADGSTAEQCGNGMRCIALLLNRNGETPGGPFQLETPGAVISAICETDGQVTVDMGRAVFDPAMIPIAVDATDNFFTLDLDSGPVSLLAASMGNPHVVLQVSDVDSAPVDELGPALSTHPDLPEGANVGFAQVLDEGAIRLRVYERGSGETLACGSGACAAAASLYRAGICGPKVQVNQKGGRLIIGVVGDDFRVSMTGPAVHVFEGKLE